MFCQINKSKGTIKNLKFIVFVISSVIYHNKAVKNKFHTADIIAFTSFIYETDFDKTVETKYQIMKSTFIMWPLFHLDHRKFFEFKFYLFSISLNVYTRIRMCMHFSTNYRRNTTRNPCNTYFFSFIYLFNQLLSPSGWPQTRDRARLIEK